MGIFDIFHHWFKHEDTSISIHEEPLTNINPATGYPMLNDCIDIAGNPYGMSDDDFLTSNDSFCDMSNSRSSLFDD